MVASSTRPRSRPSARISSSTARNPVRACEESSISTYQGCGLPAADRGSRRRGAARTRCRAAASARSWSRRRRCARCASPSSSSAASGDGTPTNAVSTERGARHQPQHRGGDDAERAFGADEQVLEIVAGVVLLELVEIVQHAAVGQHHFDAERMRARDAMGERGGAAGIGREIAADGAGAFRGQQLRIEPVDLRPPPRVRAAASRRPRRSWCSRPDRPRGCGRGG